MVLLQSDDDHSLQTVLLHPEGTSNRRQNDVSTQFGACVIKACPTVWVSSQGYKRQVSSRLGFQGLRVQEPSKNCHLSFGVELAVAQGMTFPYKFRV